LARTLKIANKVLTNGIYDERTRPLHGNTPGSRPTVCATKVSLGQIDSTYSPPFSIENVLEPLPDGEYQLFANGALVVTVRQVKGDWIAAP
jgi:hypothetical protein